MEDRLIFDSRYLVGIEQVDQEHQRLFELASRIYDSLAADIIVPMNEIQSAIDELIDYTKAHFSNEELLMEANAYPGLDDHRELHAYLISSIKDFERKVELAEQFTPVDVYEFLCSWLGDHIQASDRNFGEYFTERMAHRTGAVL